MDGTSDTAMLRLIDGIYDAGLAWERWPGVLTRLADHFGARDAALGSVGPPGLAWLVAPRTDPEFLRCYPERFHALNHVWHRTVAHGVGAAVTADMVMDRQEFRRSTYFNEWARPQGYRTVLGGLVEADRGWRTVLTLPGRDDYDPRHVRRFRLVSAHLRRAVLLNRHLHHASIERDALRQSLARMSTAAMLVDADARLLASNEAAEVLLRAERGLRITRGKLTVTVRAQQQALREAIARGTAPALADTGVTLRITLADRAALTLSVVLVHRSRAWLAPGAPAALIIDASDLSPDDEAERLRARFGLTAAEARFAIEILKGDGKHAAASRCGITYSTARSHLSRIFEKTGVRRQAELVRLIRS